MAGLIDRLRGRVVEKDAGRHEGSAREPASVVLDVNGVAYRAFVSAASFASLPPVGAEATIFTALLLREDSPELFGFLSAEERRLFQRLLGVSNVGPRLALAVLGLGADGLRRAVALGDWRALAAVPGVGRKTAERIALELREAAGVAAELAGAGGEGDPSGDPYREAAAALRQLGYSPGEAARALAALPRGSEALPVEALVREALRILAERAL